MIYSATPAQRRKDFHCSAKAQGCSAAVATVDDSEEDLPIASYDSDDNLPPSSEPRYSSPLPSPDHTPRQSPDRTPRQSPEPTPGPFNAVNCLVTVAEFATQWNSEWGTIPQWSHQFTTRYLTAVEEMRSVEFIEGVARKARIGRALIDDIAHLISNSTLPTTVSLLRVFIELTVKITIKLIKGVTILEEKLKSVTPFTGNGLRNFLASVEPVSAPSLWIHFTS